MLSRATFLASDTGTWAIDSIAALAGDPLPAARRLERHDEAEIAGGVWSLSGVRSHDRYVTREEKARLVAGSPALGRPEARCAALIPISKSEAWWALAQDERRAILEERSRHVAIGLEYVPAIARRLYHCRELGGPFDFLTWFEFAPAEGPAFEDLLGRLRASEEWRYVTREVEVRLTARPPAA